jgi:hypothetical protein
MLVLFQVKEEELDGLVPKGVLVHELPSQKKYLRITPQPE